MPSVPPFSRSEKLDDYVVQCRPVEWSEHDLKASDGTALKLLEGSVSLGQSSQTELQVVILYLQGNASSLPPRLPFLSGVLKALGAGGQEDRNFTIIALSYRGFWKSKGRPSQKGIELDVEASLGWMFGRYDPNNTKVIIWGQSIGAGAATVGLANLTRKFPGKMGRISGLLLETPFVDLETMLVALYPQKYLPYRYLGPFLLSTWNSKGALQQIGNANSGLKILILEAGDDEIVPSGQGALLEKVCKDQGLAVSRATVAGALHTEVMMKPLGRSHIVNFIKTF